MPLSSIQKVIGGNDYRDFMIQHVGLKTFKKSSSSLLAQSGFCIQIADLSEPVNLTTDDEDKVTTWLEGLNCLLNRSDALRMPSIKSDVEQMVSMEVRIRLLDIAPPTTAPPPIPPLPTDFSWIPEKYRVKLPA